VETSFETVALELMLGGTPMPGVTVGGGLHVDSAWSVNANRRSFSNLLFVGPFVDIFPDPRGGFHVGGMLGGAALVHDNPDLDPVTYRGFGASLWLGYDLWIAEQWSLGAMLAGGVARLASTDRLAPDAARVDSVAVLLGWLYH
jgi:hypothetical protein